MLLPTANRTPTSVYTLLHTPCIIFMHIPVWTLSLRKHARRSVCVSLCKCTPLERHSMATNPIHPENMNSYCCGLAFFSQESSTTPSYICWHAMLTWLTFYTDDITGGHCPCSISDIPGMISTRMWEKLALYWEPRHFPGICIHRVSFLPLRQWTIKSTVAPFIEDLE